MNHGMVTLAELLPVGLLADLKEQQRRSEPRMVAPAPKAPRVVGDPTRTPVNRQAAMMTAKAGWLYQPFPAESPARPALEKLIEEINRLKTVNATMASENLALRKKLERVSKLTQCPSRPAPKPEPVQPEIPQSKIQLLERLQNL